MRPILDRKGAFLKLRYHVDDFCIRFQRQFDFVFPNAHQLILRHQMLLEIGRPLDVSIGDGQLVTTQFLEMRWLGMHK